MVNKYIHVLIKFNYPVVNRKFGTHYLPHPFRCVINLFQMKTKTKNMKPNTISGLTPAEWKIIREVKVLMTMTLEELMMVEVRGIPLKA